MPRTLATARYSIGGYQAKVLSYSPIAYWPLNETSGTVADNAQGDSSLDGIYNGVFLGRTTFVNGEPAGLWVSEGNNSTADIYDATLGFNPLVGTMMAFAKIGYAGLWTDSTTRRIFRLAVNSSNEVYIGRATSSNSLQFRYTAGGVINSNTPGSGNPVNWFHVAITWDKAADEVKHYLNGVQLGATLTGLGVWAGSLNSANCAIGAASSAGTNPWLGYIHDVALFGSALSATAIANLAVVN